MRSSVNPLVKNFSKISSKFRVYVVNEGQLTLPAANLNDPPPLNLNDTPKSE